ncbi:MAG: sulfite exporter TauE/SafE family protein [Thermoplasmatota archaeon]
MASRLAAWGWIGLVPVAAVMAWYHGFTWELVARSAGVGFAGGLAGGLIAGAIGLVSVPLITLVLGIPIHQAVATNLFQTIFTAATGAASHRRLGNVDLRLSTALLAGAFPGAPVGAMASLRLSETALRGLFAGILLLMAANLLRRLARGKGAKPPRPLWAKAVERLEADGRVAQAAWWKQPIEGTFRGHHYHIPRYLPVLLGAGIGFTSGLLGIGGGFLVTPLVATILHVPTHLAVGTGLVVISGNSLFGVAPHMLAGNVLFTVGVLLAIGGSIGAQIGSRLSHHLPERALYALFFVTLLVVAWRMSPWTF